MKDLEIKVRNIWIAQGLFISLFLTGLIFLSLYIYSTLTLTEQLIIALVVFPLIALGLSYYMIERYKNWGFDLRKDHLYLQYGVLIKKKSMVPYVRVQHIDTQRGIIDRIAGLTKIVVFTAGSRGADVTIPGLDPKEAGKMQRWLRDVAIRSEEKDAV